MDHNIKTIFLTVGTGVVARNLLNNSFYKKLKGQYNIILFTPLFNDAEFQKLYGGENVIFSDLIHRKLTRIELFIISLHKSLIYNKSVRIKAFYSLSSTMKQKRTAGKVLKNYIEYIIFGIFLSKIPPLRNLLKVIDRTVYNENLYQDVFDKYKPSLLFVTNMSSDDEVYLVRSAKKNGVANVGMTKSWDNFSKIGYREWVDKVIVWSDYMVDEVLTYQNYGRGDIAVVGIPQFDVLHDVNNSHTREDFIKTYRLNPDKKTILFGQSNPLLNPDDAYVCGIIKKWVEENEGKYQILIRPHFRHKDAEKPFLPLVDNKNVYIDLLNNPSNFTSGAWDLSPESQIRRAISLRFSDVVVNSTSTLVLDAAASDNFFISYAFDKDKNLPYGESIRRIFDLLWYVDLKKYGFDKLMVHNEKELLERLNEILNLKNRILPDEHERIVRRFCYKADGRAGARLFNVIDNTIKKKHLS